MRSESDIRHIDIMLNGFVMGFFGHGNSHFAAIDTGYASNANFKILNMFPSSIGKGFIDRKKYSNDDVGLSKRKVEK